MLNVKNTNNIVILVGLLIIVGTTFSVAEDLIKYTVSKSPIVKIATPRPNIFLALDDSASMHITSMHISGGTHAYMWVQEHFFGPGNPECEKRSGTTSTEWTNLVNKYKKMGEAEGVKYYNPFETGRYIPYLISKEGSSGISKIEYDKYIGAIPIERCYSKVYRTEAVIQMTPEILEKYSKRAYLGYGGFGKEELPRYAGASHAGIAERRLAKMRKYFDKEKLWDYNEAGKQISDAEVVDDINYNVFIQPITDMSSYDANEWGKIKRSIARDIMGEYQSGTTKNFMLGNTPTFNTVYNLSLYFRGYPIVNKAYVFPYGTKDIEAPKRYRCTTNSIIVLTDGNSNDKTLGVVATKDLSGYGGSLPTASGANENPDEGLRHYNKNKTYSFTGKLQNLNEMISREFTVNSMRDGKYEEKDAAGKGWNSDKFAIKQKLQINAVQYGIGSFNSNLRNLTEVSGGQVITLAEDATSTAILGAMDTIMSDLIRSTSNAQVSINQFNKTDNSIRYTFKYNMESRRGEVIAHKADSTGDSSWAEYQKNKEGKFEPITLWRSEVSILPTSGRFITMDYEKSSPKPALIAWNSIRSGYQKGTDQSHLHANHISWLMGTVVIDDINLPSENRVYKKLSPMGAIVNSEVGLFLHDVEYINLRYVGKDIRKEFNEYVKYKNKVLNKDYMIINSNDGMVNFLSVPRGSPTIEEELKKGTKSVERVTAYFPGILAYRLPDLSGLNAVGYSMDGMIGLFEFKDSQGDIRSIGLSGMGAGGKGLVGYQFFKATPSLGSNPAFKNHDTEIKPLFEIANEGNWVSYDNNKLFANLGYTFSDFSFYNRAHPDSSKEGQGVAVFGNGYGQNKSGKSPSSLYFIDAETGEFIEEIILNEKGGGASSPALVVANLDDYQILKKIYVGDISGQLYRITFASDELSDYTLEVLYEPLDGKYNPISTRPLVVQDPKISEEWIYFGTGRNSDQKLDRGENSPSKDTQYVVALKNPKRIEDRPLTIEDLQQNKIVLPTKKVKVNDGKPNEQEIEYFSTDVDTNEEKIKLGWFLPLSQSKSMDSSLRTAGERVVFSPRQTFSDVVFSTWGLDEYDTSDGDPCVEDYAYGKTLILDKKTGTLGTAKLGDKSVGGLMVKEGTLGATSMGHGLTEGRLSGESFGESTLDKATIKELNKAADSSHTLAKKNVCIGNIANDMSDSFDFTVECPPKIPLDSARRISIRRMH